MLRSRGSGLPEVMGAVNPGGCGCKPFAVFSAATPREREKERTTSSAFSILERKRDTMWPIVGCQTYPAKRWKVRSHLPVRVDIEIENSKGMSIGRKSSEHMDLKIHVCSGINQTMLV